MEATMEEVYSGLLSYLADNSNRIGFPELVTPMQFQLKDFLKRCKAASFSKKVKQVLERTVANAKFIETRRKNVSFGVGDKTAIQAWEAQVARDGTPLLAFYKSWKKVADVQQAKKVSDQEKISDFSHIPALKKNHKKLRMKREEEEEEDEEDDQDDAGGGEDEVEDLNLEDLDSDLELEDDFGAASGADEDESDQGDEEDSDDDSDDESDQGDEEDS